MIKKMFLTIVLAVSLFSSEYKIEKEHSSIKFNVTKMLFVGVEGEFSSFKGTINTNENNELSNIDGIVSIDSINTDDIDRDNHLKADDYFNIVKFPNIIFKSSIITNDLVTAKVLIKGIEKELAFKISDFKVSKNDLSFKLSAIVNRQDFMLNGSKSGLFSDDIEVTANLVAVRMK